MYGIENCFANCLPFHDRVIVKVGPRFDMGRYGYARVKADATAFFSGQELVLSSCLYDATFGARAYELSEFAVRGCDLPAVFTPAKRRAGDRLSLATTSQCGREISNETVSAGSAKERSQMELCGECGREGSQMKITLLSSENGSCRYFFLGCLPSSGSLRLVHLL